MARNVTQRVRDEQLYRYDIYPKYRIPFLASASAVSEDQTNFRDYVEGRITLKMLCIRIAHTNRLPKVSEEAMLWELKNIGWIK